MKKAMRLEGNALLLAVVLTACGQSETPKQADVPTVEELASDPAHLKELRQQCNTVHATLGDVLCNRVAEAKRKRLYGNGKCLVRRRRNRSNSEDICDSARQRHADRMVVRIPRYRYDAIWLAATHSV